MLRTSFAVVAITVFLVGLSSCANNNSVMTPTESRLDENWGRSFESAKFNQILNPEAGKKLDPVTGLDGQAADAEIQQYRKTFSQQPSTSTGGSSAGFTLGTEMGTGMGTGTK